MKYTQWLALVAIACVLSSALSKPMKVGGGKRDKNGKRLKKQDDGHGCKFVTIPNTNVEISADIQLIENKHPKMKALSACRKSEPKCHLFVEAPDKSYQLFRYVDPTKDAELKTVANSVGYTLTTKRCGGDRIFSKEDRAAIKNRCTKHPEKCQATPEQIEKVKKQRDDIKKTLTETSSAAEAEATMTAAKNLQEAIYASIGIPMPETAFTGLFNRDLVLTAEQSNALTAVIQATKDYDAADLDDPALVASSSARKRRAAFVKMGGGAHEEGGPAQGYFFQQWPTPSNIPFKFRAGHFTATEQQLIRDSLNQISAQAPCVHFTESTATTGLIIFEGNDDGCWSSLGKVSTNVINLAKGCFTGSVPHYLGTIIHEIMHALGIMHEQSRPDRDTYLNIYWSNIDADYVSQYAKMLEFWGETPTYDYESLMHYDEYSFSNNSLKAMEAKNPAFIGKLGDRYSSSVLTPADEKAIRIVYCGEHLNTTVPTTPGPGSTAGPTQSTAATTTNAAGATCSHDVCTSGDALDSSCGTCAATICDNHDSFCCDKDIGSWDEMCVDQALYYCEIDEPCIYEYYYGDY